MKLNNPILKAERLVFTRGFWLLSVVSLTATFLSILRWKNKADITKECKCPSGYPRRKQYDFGNEARSRAFQWDIPVPGFEVEAHTGECLLTDEVKVPLLSFEVARSS